MKLKIFAASLAVAAGFAAASTPASAAGLEIGASVVPVVIPGPTGRPIPGCAYRYILGKWRVYCPRRVTRFRGAS